MKSQVLGGALSPAGVLKLLSQNQAPIRFVTPTAALLPGLEQWIGNFEHICLTDSFDGQGRNALVASGLTTQDFHTSQEAVSNLMQNEDVQAQLGDADIVFSNINDNATSRLSEAEAWGLLRDSKIATTLRAIEPSANYADFRKQCRAAGISFTVEVVLASAEAGSRPWLIASEEDWQNFETHLAGQPLICAQPPQSGEIALEGVVTVDGTILSPLQRICREHFWEVRHWIGATCDESLAQSHHKACIPVANRLGAGLSARGFRGAFSVEFESNSAAKPLVSRLLPGLSINSVLPHMLTSFHGGFPIHLIHVVSKLGVDPAIDVAALKNQYGLHDSWTVLAVRHSGPAAEMITRAPRSGLYRMNSDGSLSLIDAATDWRFAIGNESAYYLRLQGAGNYRASGTLLGLIYMRMPGIDEQHRPAPVAGKWLDAFAAAHAGLSVSGSSLPTGIITHPFSDII